MAKKDSLEFEAKLTTDNGVTRGRIPARLVTQLGGQAGDYIVFRQSASGTFALSLKKATTIAAASPASKKIAAAASSSKRK